MSSAEMVQDPEIEILSTEILPGVSARAQALIAQREWMIECAHRECRPWGKIPPYPSEEIEGPFMRCCCEGRIHPGHLEHIQGMTNQEQDAVADFLLRLEAATPINWILLRDWMQDRFPNHKPRFDKDRDPPLYWDDDAYVYHFRYFYSEEVVKSRTDAQVRAQAAECFRSDTERYEKWLRDKKRLATCLELIAKLSDVSPMRARLEFDSRDAKHSVKWFEDFHSLERPILRTIEEQRAWEIEDAARSRISLREQIVREQQAMRDAVPDLKDFLSKLNPADW